MQWRLVNDRRELIADTCDELAMKDSALAVGVAGLRVPTTHWSGTDIGDLTGVEPPERWVLKPDHRYG